MNLDSRKLLSYPVRIVWAGWETDTLRLHQAGWQLSAQENVQNRSMRIALNHPEAHIQGVTSESHFDYFDYNDHYLRSIVLQARLASEWVATINNLSTQVQFEAIDPQPYMMERQSLQDFAHFKKIHGEETKEILLKQASMAEILQMALEKQEPDQERIRKQLLHKDRMEEIKRNSIVKAELRLVA